MRTLIARVLILAGSLVLAGCASSSRSLPKFEKPLARAAVMNVRTTAYTHTEADHIEYSNKTALGGTLQCGRINSAAADWSRWPAGSVFRIRETGEIFQVDDYGWALAGTNTIDLYKPSKGAMNQWGVKRVTIENLRWGDPRRSLAILRPRSRYAHIRRMVDQLEERMPEYEAAMRLTSAEPAPASELAPLPAPAPVPAPSNLLVGRAETTTAAPATLAPRAQAVPKLAGFNPSTDSRTAQTTRTTGTTATREAFLNSYR